MEKNIYFKKHHTKRDRGSIYLLSVYILIKALLINLITRHIGKSTISQSLSIIFEQCSRIFNHNLQIQLQGDYALLA